MSRKLVKTLQRIYRREIPGTDGYPAKMDFLGDVPFYAITQVLPPGAKRTQLSGVNYLDRVILIVAEHTIPCRVYTPKRC